MGATDAARDPDAVRALVERFAGIMVDSGIPRMPARVFAQLLCSDSGRLTAAELAEELTISPAAVSQAVRYLQMVRLVARGRAPGSRRDHIEVRADPLYEAMLHREDLISGWHRVSDEGAGLLGRDTPAGARIAELAEFFAFVRAELPRLLERWHAQRAPSPAA